MPLTSPRQSDHIYQGSQVSQSALWQCFQRHQMLLFNNVLYLGLFCRFIQEKNGSKFSQIEAVRLRGGDPPSGQPDRFFPFFFYYFPQCFRFLVLLQQGHAIKVCVRILECTEWSPLRYPPTCQRFAPLSLPVIIGILSTRFKHFPIMRDPPFVEHMSDKATLSF